MALTDLGYTVSEVREGVFWVEGFGVATYASAEDLDSLEDSGAHTERAFQHSHPHAHAARNALERAGAAVNRVKPTEDRFNVAGAGLDERNVLPDALPRLARQVGT